ncbi:ASPSCR1, UBX domain containing tether for SLC2A4 [Willisornis vidua]|uniref:ASPSCR1, UBX domain containing tether for SLC2A4 n=1 Tax=Willisornis vidua TaxID=1566151 RepID=A0ABQ9DLY5_9PASS|nr:ASPSCR1, UBX domain containing tether for SLC2A4 [Willisornis vidua]
MAATGGGGTVAAVSVLAPTGRRVTVRVGPGTVLLQTMFSFRFQRNVLDLSLQWRFARLPNNAKLEMVPVSNRAGAGTTVRIALQLDDGSRLQDTFLCHQTLWELLNHFAKIRELMEQHGDFSPVCIYMRDEVSGKDALEKTTLKLLGLTGGSAVVRVVMKKSSSGQEEAVGATTPCNEPTARTGSLEGADDVLLHQTNTVPEDLVHEDVAISLNSSTHNQDSTKESHANLEELWPPSELEPTPFVPFSGDGECLGDSSVAAPSFGLDAPLSKMPTTFSSPGGPSKPKKSKNSQEFQKEQEQLVEREPLVCHLDLLEQLPDGPEELPDEFFEVTVDDVRKRLAQLQSERQVPFLLKRLEEAPLMTKALRESQLKEKLERYPKVVLRVHFPDRHVLQGFFHPSETVVAPPRIILNDESLTLFEDTGWTELDFCSSYGGSVRGRTVFSANGHVACANGHVPCLRPFSPFRSWSVMAKLFPTAVIHFGSEECRACYLKSDLLSSAVSPSAADLLVARYLSRSFVPSASSSVASGAPSLSEPEVETNKKTSEPPEAASTQGAPQGLRRAPGKIPKWLKLPGGKR